MKLNTLFLIIVLMFPGFIMAADEAAPKPAYFQLKPSVVANMKTGAKYVRFDVQLMLKDEADLEAVKGFAPALSHEMLLLVSDQDGAVLKTPDGKETFRKAAKDAANKVLKEFMDKKPVKDLFFTAFFVQ